MRVIQTLRDMNLADCYTKYIHDIRFISFIFKILRDKISKSFSVITFAFDMLNQILIAKSDVYDYNDKTMLYNLIE